MEDDTVARLLGLGFATCALGAGLSAFAGRRAGRVLALAHGLAGLGALALAAAAAGALRSGHALDLGQVPLLPFLGALRFRLDALSAFFLLLIGSLGAAASLYAVGYTAGRGGPEDPSPALLGSLWNLFIPSMAALVLAADGLGFLFLWELMSAVSFLLVMAEHRELEVRQAGYFYAVMTHVGTTFLVGAFLALLARTGSLDFAVFRTAAPALPGGMRDGLFLAVCIGFGTKAGLVPLHVWLPRAHPAAPSHVSALMSGAMVKTAVYGLLRFALDLLGGGPPWWGVLLAAAGGISLVAGSLYATQQGHLKRLLAYSTVDNVGLLTMGIGAALLARAYQWPALAALALGAVLFHALSHAAFKGLAFLGAGAVLHGTGTADMERLGGLIRPMPRTAALSLVAAMAIAGLPPLSGFIGEWLSLQTFLRLAGAGTGLLWRLGALTAVAAIALSAGLGTAAALKSFGIAFLALPRSPRAEHAHDAGGTMVAGMLVLAAAVLGLGLFPGAALGLAQPAIGGLLPGAAVPAAAAAPGALAGASLQPLTLAAVLAGAGALALGAAVVLGRGWPRWRRGLTWTCGIAPGARMQYSGAGYSKPILLMFRGLLLPVRTLAVDRSQHPLFPGRVHYQSEVTAVFELYLYRPVTRAVLAAATRLRRLQTGSLQAYLLYLLVAAVAVIMAAREGG